VVDDPVLLTPGLGLCLGYHSFLEVTFVAEDEHREFIREIDLEDVEEHLEVDGEVREGGRLRQIIYEDEAIGAAEKRGATDLNRSSPAVSQRSYLGVAVLKREPVSAHLHQMGEIEPLTWDVASVFGGHPAVHQTSEAVLHPGSVSLLKQPAIRFDRFPNLRRPRE
jgi:hypothetical protein